jgi:hypothetical protein
MVHLMIVVITVLVMQQITAILWRPKVHITLLQNELNKVQSSRSMIRPTIDQTWKRILLPTESLRDNIGKEEHHSTNITTGHTTDVVGSVSDRPTTTSVTLWIHRTMTRAVSIMTYFAIGQSIVHLLHTNRLEIANEVRHTIFCFSF